MPENNRAEFNVVSLKNWSKGAHNIANAAGHFLDQIKEDHNFQELTEQLKINPLLKAIQTVDVKSAQEAVKTIQKEHSDWTLEQTVNHLIQNKVLLLGAKGFATSVFPGFAAGLFTIDLATSLAMQAELIYQIADVYGFDLKDPSRQAEAMAMFSLGIGGSAALKAGMGFARNIPMAGAVIGAGGNAVMTYALGTSASKYYQAIAAGQSNDEALELGQQTSQKILSSADSQEHALDEILAHMILAGSPDLELQDLLNSLDQLPLEKKSREHIKQNIHDLREIDEVLKLIDQALGVAILVQAERLAVSDAHITEQEQALLEKLEQHFSQLMATQTKTISNQVLSTDFKHTIRALQFSPDDQYLCAVSDDKSLKIWKKYHIAKSFHLLHTIDKAHTKEIKSLSIDQAGLMLATASKDKQISFWDYKHGKQLQSLESGHSKAINTIKFCGTSRLVSGSEDGEIKVWNTNTFALQRSLLEHQKSILSLDYFSDANQCWLLSGSNDNSARIWDMKSGEVLKVLEGHRHGVYAVAFSPDGKSVATGSWDQTICLWDVESGEKHTTLSAHTAAVWQLKFSRNGKFLISSADDNSILLWDLSTQKVRIKLDGHQNGVYSLALASQAPILASGSWDCSLRLWHLDLDN